MRHFLALVIILMLSTSCSSTQSTQTNQITTISSENLDLELVANIFGESTNLEDFEKRLNDPKAKNTNLDLNNDGKVDYLRVSEKSDGDSKIVYIDACMADDKFKNVAKISIEKENNNYNVQLTGSEVIYGVNYVIRPRYVATPRIAAWFWSPNYVLWRSPYRYRYYPAYYTPWRVVKPSIYRKSVRQRVRIRTAPARRRAWIRH